MSRTNQELETISNFQADFDEFLSQEKYDDCRALIDTMGELGYETESMILFRALNAHFAKEDTTPTEWRERADDNKF
jgi:hypothetical protein